MDYLDKNVAIAYLEKMESEIRSNFDRIRRENFNPNTKGYNYEDTLAEFFSLYLSGGFNFYLRSPLLDINLMIEEVFQKGENEFDVLATYKNTIPGLVYRIHKTEYIPYDSIAFITEAKQTLTKPNLRKDLEKLRKLDKLERGNPFKYLDFPYLRKKPERILFYYERSAKESTIIELLESAVFKESWEIVIILKDDIALINETNYVAREIMNWSTWGISRRFPLLKSMIHATYPTPYMVNAWDLVLNLLRSVDSDNDASSGQK